MKTILAVLTLLCATAAFGQSFGTVLSNEPQIFEATSHQQHASQKAMAEEQTLLAQSNNIQAKGERPLWEFAQPKYSMPLGDAARILRKEHASAKKATFCLYN